MGRGKRANVGERFEYKSIDNLVFSDTIESKFYITYSRIAIFLDIHFIIINFTI